MRVPTTLVTLVLAGAVLSALPAVANQEAAEKNEAKAASKEAKWQGEVVRMSKDKSTLQIHGGPAPSKATRMIEFDSSTEWTKGGKPGEMDEVKAGSFVIVVGHVNHKGVMHATQVDLRLPR